MLLQSDERLVFVARRQGTANGALPRPFFTLKQMAWYPPLDLTAAASKTRQAAWWGSLQRVLKLTARITLRLPYREESQHW